MGIISRYGNVIFHPATHPSRLVNPRNEEFILWTQRTVMQRDALRLLNVYKAHIKTGGHVVFDAYAEHLARLREVFSTEACANFRNIERQIDTITQEHTHNSVYGGIGREMAKIAADLVWDTLKKTDNRYEVSRLRGIGYDTSILIRQFANDLKSQAFQAILFKASLTTYPEKAIKQKILEHVCGDDYAKLQRQHVGITLGALFAALTITPPSQLQRPEVRANSHAEAQDRRELLRLLALK